MDDVSGVVASEVRDGNADLLVVVSQVDADVLLQLLVPTERGVSGVVVTNPAVKQVLLWDLHTISDSDQQIRKQRLYQK